MEGKKISIPLSGIVRNTPEIAARDGELTELINLRHKDGAKRPVPDSLVVASGIAYSNICVHSSVGSKRMLGVSAGNLYYFATFNNKTVSSITPVLLMPISGKPQYSQSGNVVSVKDNTGLSYAVWYDAEYKVISSDFDGTQYAQTVGPVRVDLRVTVKEQTPRAYRNTTSRNYASVSAADADIASVAKEFDGLWLKAIASERKRGALHGFALGCTAVQLFDGSYILHSAPILLGQAVDAQTRYGVTLGGNEYKYNEKQRLTQYTVLLPHYKPFNMVDVIELDAEGGFSLPLPEGALGGLLDPKRYGSVSPNHLVQSAGVTGQFKLPHPNPDDASTNTYWTYELSPADAMAHPVYTEHYNDDIPAGTKYRVYMDRGAGGIDLYVATRTSSSMPLLPFTNIIGQFHKDTSSAYNSLSHYPLLIIRGNKLQYRAFSQISENLRPIVRSVSVFITPEVSMYKDEACTRTASYKVSADRYVDNYSKPIKTEAEILKELKDLRFRKVHDIEFDTLRSITPGTWQDIDLTDKLGEMLDFQELMPVDDFTHHKMRPSFIASYNAELHAVNYTTDLSRGWPVEYFHASNFYGVGQFRALYPDGEVDEQGWIEYAAVRIKTSNGESKVVRVTPEFQSGGFVYLNIFNLSPLISYPDSRAIELIIYRSYYDTAEGRFFEQKKVFPLTESDNHNFAYYIDPNLKPIDFTEGYFTDDPVGIVPEVQRSLPSTNRFKVSSVNNPFYFPAEKTYSVGNGSLIGVASNAAALSTGQFGEFPLYVFHSEGVDAMFVGNGGVSYAASRNVARDVCTNADSITPIDGGVLFATSRGLMVMSGGKPVEISETISGAITPYNLAGGDHTLAMQILAMSNAQLVQLSTQYAQEVFSTFMQNAIVGYHYNEKEVWIVNPAKAYCYIYSLKHQIWSKLAQTGSEFVRDYPYDYLLKGGSLKDISTPGSGPVDVALLTRPIHFGTKDFKQSTRAVMRGYVDIAADKFAGIYVYGSYDGVRYAFLGGSEIEGKRVDIGALVERSDCKYFRVGFVGRLSSDSHLDMIDMTAAVKLGNKVR